eukprot:gene24908-32460_t
MLLPVKVNKVEADLKKLTKLDGNKLCANCQEKIPGYAEMTHCIFICTKCAGVHREYQYKVKGISMSSFTDEDVQQLSRVGNEAHNAIYMARFTPGADFQCQIPDGRDIVKLKEFIRMKYVDRRWYGDPTESNTRNFSSLQPKTTHQGFAITSSAVNLLEYPISPPKHPADKVISRSASLALSSQNVSQDPFSIVAHGQTTASRNIDPFKSDLVPNVGDSAFDPFGSYVGHPDSSQSSSNVSFDPFGDGSGKASGTFHAIDNSNTFSAYPYPNPSNPFSSVNRQLNLVPTVGSSPFDHFGSNFGHPSTNQLPRNGLFDPFGETSSKATGGFSAFDDLFSVETADAANLKISGGPDEPGEYSFIGHDVPAVDETTAALKKILNVERARRLALESEMKVLKNQNSELLSSLTTLSSLPEQITDLQDVNAQLETELDRMMGRKHAVD